MPAAPAEPAGTRTPPELFEHIYRARSDPWGYATSAYEQAKYQRTLDALGERRPRRALELGAAEGVFTAMLAGRCDHVVAMEPAQSALARARQRLAGCDNVQLVGAAVPEGLPEGPFDAVFCSEVLCYLDRHLVSQTLTSLERRLAPGGSLIAAHYRGRRRDAIRLRLRRGTDRPPSPPAPLSADTVHSMLRARPRLRLVHEVRRGPYRLDRLDLR